MADGYTIAGKVVTENALYPWSVGSVARALLFYAQRGSGNGHRALSAVANYYALFHLGMFLVFISPDLQTVDTKGRIQQGLKDGNDPSPKVRHRDLLDCLQLGAQHGLPDGILQAFERAQKLRNFINYGPRIRWRGTGNIYVDTCAHSHDELARLQMQLEPLFHEAIDWACDWGSDNGIWVPTALSATEAFFVGENPLYANWCAPGEAATAESLRVELAEEAKSKVFGSKAAG